MGVGYCAACSAGWTGLDGCPLQLLDVHIDYLWWVIPLEVTLGFVIKDTTISTFGNICASYAGFPQMLRNVCQLMDTESALISTDSGTISHMSVDVSQTIFEVLGIKCHLNRIQLQKCSPFVPLTIEYMLSTHNTTAFQLHITINYYHQN